MLVLMALLAGRSGLGALAEPETGCGSVGFAVAVVSRQQRNTAGTKELTGECSKICRRAAMTPACGHMLSPSKGAQRVWRPVGIIAATLMPKRGRHSPRHRGAPQR
ncbi:MULTISPECIES: hypothetical protein [Mycobacterium]|uniref:hypothetical protein n=1 Tax=Mycobacterium TaxID=1763 RepID=UPI0012E3A2BB|nr:MULTISPECIES: hypothetical protein [Mycobacterium]MDP7732815.1 hypothetical protein [Mycobacterium sp. TY813]